MAKEEKKCETCCDELYGGDPEVVKELVKSIENRRVFIKKVMKPAEDASKELEKATATKEVRLQGTKEPKPVIKPYTEKINVKDRKELGVLIESAKAEKRPWKVERSKKEGFRYVFITKVLKEAKKKEEEETEPELDLDIAPEEEVKEPEEETSEEETPLENEEPKEEEKPELTMGEIFGKYFDIHGNEDHSITICLKGKMGEEDCVCITTEPLEDEEYELLKGEFHNEEPEEEEPIEGEEEVISPELLDLDIAPEDDQLLNNDGTVETKVSNQSQMMANESLKKLDEGFYTMNFHVKEGHLDEFLNIILDDEAEHFKEEGLKNGNIKELEDGSYVVFIYAHSSIFSKWDEYKNLVTLEDGKFWDEHENINEASSAETKAYKQGGQAYADLVAGRAIARIKDPNARKAAVAAMKANRPEVAKQFYGDRKEGQAIQGLEDKFGDMSKAGVADESLTEQLLVEEDAIVNDDTEIKLDDLQYFKPVAGARETWQEIQQANKLVELANVLGDFAKDGKMTTSDLNDLLWFEKEWVFDKLGIVPGIKSGDDVIEAEPIEVSEE